MKKSIFLILFCLFKPSIGNDELIMQHQQESLDLFYAEQLESNEKTDLFFNLGIKVMPKEKRLLSQYYDYFYMQQNSELRSDLVHYVDLYSNITMSFFENMSPFLQDGFVRFGIGYEHPLYEGSHIKDKSRLGLNFFKVFFDEGVHFAFDPIDLYCGVNSTVVCKQSRDLLPFIRFFSSGEHSYISNGIISTKLFIQPNAGQKVEINQLLIEKFKISGSSELTYQLLNGIKFLGGYCLDILPQRISLNQISPFGHTLRAGISCNLKYFSAGVVINWIAQPLYPEESPYVLGIFLNKYF